MIDLDTLLFVVTAPDPAARAAEQPLPLLIDDEEIDDPRGFLDD